MVHEKDSVQCCSLRVWRNASVVALEAGKGEGVASRLEPPERTAALLALILAQGAPLWNSGIQTVLNLCHFKPLGLVIYYSSNRKIIQYITLIDFQMLNQLAFL